MNNLFSYCGLIDAKIGASDKDLPVLFAVNTRVSIVYGTCLRWTQKIDLGIHWMLEFPIYYLVTSKENVIFHPIFELFIC